MATGARDLNTDTGCLPAAEPQWSLATAWAQTSLWSLGGSSVHPHLYGPGGSVTLGHQHGLGCQPIPWESAQSSVVSEAIDINTDPGCSKTIDPAMLLRSSLGLDANIALSGSSLS